MKNVVMNFGTARFKSKTNGGDSANYFIKVCHSTVFPEHFVIIRKRVLTKDYDLYTKHFFTVRVFKFKGEYLHLMEQTISVRKQSFDVINTCVDQILRTYHNSLN